jgi:hypothetical protein
MIAAALCFYVFLIVYALGFWYTVTARFVGVVALLIALGFLMVAIKETVLLYKVIKHKYKLISSKILSIRPFDKYGVTNNLDMVFELANLKIFVPFYRSEQFRVGDQITAVIVRKRRYPLVILKHKSTRVHR